MGELLAVEVDLKDAEQVGVRTSRSFSTGKPYVFVAPVTFCFPIHGAATLRPNTLLLEPNRHGTDVQCKTGGQKLLATHAHGISLARSDCSGNVLKLNWTDLIPRPASASPAMSTSARMRHILSGPPCPTTRLETSPDA